MMKVLFSQFILVVLFACSKSTSGINTPAPPIVVRDSTTSTSPKAFLALGDSYTIGQSVKEEERFPAQTIFYLKQEGFNFTKLDYIAQTGWTTANLQSAIAAQNPQPVYEVVTLLIGVNDQYQRMDTSGYATRFEQLLQKAIQLAKDKKSNVFVVSIPDYSATPFVPAADKPRVSTEINRFNEINKRITNNYGVSYTDITPSSREAASNPALVAGDGLHPSGAEYQKWAALLAPKIKAALQ